MLSKVIKWHHITLRLRKKFKNKNPNLLGFLTFSRFIITCVVESTLWFFQTVYIWAMSSEKVPSSPRKM